MIDVIRLDKPTAEKHLDDLRELLTDAVDDGAAITFMAPIPRNQAAAFWRDRIAAVSAGACVLLAALENGRLVGSVQVTLDTPPNQRHRADINKLVVLRSHRRRGIARALMEAAHDAALKERRSLLTLDTRQNDAAEPLYRSLGYIEIGIVPRYSRSADGMLDAAVFFYKELA